MIHTVTGPINKEELGVTLSHEHISWDSTDTYTLYFDKVYDEEKLEDKYSKTLPVFNRLYELGCKAIVETSPPWGGQNVKLLQKLSQASGIKVIPNTGRVFTPEHTKYAYEIHKESYEKDLAKRWIEDFDNGLDTINNVVIRPGYIKLLIGDDNDDKLSEIDRKILQAAIITSKATGLPIHCHLLEAKTAEDALSIVEKEKLDFTKFLWAHASHEGNFDVIDKAFSKGAWIGEFYFIKSSTQGI